MKQLKIIQFSDLHLFKGAQQKLLNVNTDRSFHAVLSLARRIDWPPDLILLTGDQSQDGTPESYRRLARKLSPLNIPVYCLPGNHDIQSSMKKAFRGPNLNLSRQLIFGRWNMIFLDSTIKGSHKGNLRAGELSFLKSALRKYPKHHALIGFHHSPFKLRSEWLDTMKIKNAKKFLNVVDKKSNVCAVVFGHVHQAVSKKRKGIHYIAAPSTCVQFKPKKNRFKLDTAAPGYQVIALGIDGSVSVRVRRIKHSLFKPDMSSRGY